jgi:hypothetical protein
VATLGFDDLPNVVDFTVENFDENAAEEDDGTSDGGFAGNDRPAIIVEGPGLEITTGREITRRESPDDREGGEVGVSGGSGGLSSTTQGPS